MTHGFARWIAAPMVLLSLTACTSLTDANGAVPSPPTTAAPTPSASTAWEREQASNMGVFEFPEESPAEFTEETLFVATKDTMPKPLSLVPEGVTNVATAWDLDATNTQQVLRLPEPLSEGTVSVVFACVDGSIEVSNDETGSMGIECDGTTTSFLLQNEGQIKSLALRLKVTPGTSYSVAVFPDQNSTIIYD